MLHVVFKTEITEHPF